MKVEPRIITRDALPEELVEVYFDLTIIIDKDNELVVIDNTQADYHDAIDCNTIAVHNLIIPM
jgi:hypothetical protein